MRHLGRVASHALETGMHSKNLAIVWAPNLLRYAALSLTLFRCSVSLRGGVGGGGEGGGWGGYCGCRKQGPSAASLLMILLPPNMV